MKAITKEYLIRQLQNFDDVILEDKYLQIGAADKNVIESVKVNGTALTVDANKAVNVEAVTSITLNGSADGVTNTNGAVNVELPAAVQYKIAEAATAETGYLKTYKLQANTGDAGAYVDVSGAASINIPKDFLVKSATLGEVETDDDPVAGYEVGDKYLDFVINTKGVDEAETDEHIYINVKDLFNPYLAGVGLALNGNTFSVAVAANGGLAVDANGVAVKLDNTIGGLVVGANGLAVDFETVDIDFTTEYNSNYSA